MTTDRPDPTPADLLAAARALLAQAEAMMREPAEAAPTPGKPDRFGDLCAAVEARAARLPPLGYAVGVDHGAGPDAMATILARYHDDPPTWTAAPAAPPEPKPAGVVLRGWEQDQRHSYVWNLLRPDGRLVAWTNSNGWSTDDCTGPETGLRGKAAAVDRLLADGARWESDARWSASLDHIPETVREFRPDDVALMTDGTRRTVEETTRTRILFTDGSWLSFDAAETAIAARVPAAGVPF